MKESVSFAFKTSNICTDVNTRLLSNVLYLPLPYRIKRFLQRGQRLQEMRYSWVLLFPPPPFLFPPLHHFAVLQSNLLLSIVNICSNQVFQEKNTYRDLIFSSFNGSEMLEFFYSSKSSQRQTLLYHSFKVSL